MMHRNEPQYLRMQHTGNSFREQIISLLEVCVHFTQQSVPSCPPPSCFEGNRVCYVHHLQPHWQVQGQYYPSKHGVQCKLEISPGLFRRLKTNQTLTTYFISRCEHLLAMLIIILQDHIFIDLSGMGHCPTIGL